MVTETEWAWLAGIIDGEGTIGIKKAKAGYNRRKSPEYDIAMSIRMTHLPTIELVSRLIGAVVKSKAPKNVICHSISYGVTISSSRLGLVLEKVLPYMVTKKDQALLALEYNQQCRQPTGSTSVTPEMAELRELHYQNMKRMNTKGPINA